ncbi:MAG TPA: hypothetical protein VKQ36_14215 [Ktedonobacterales bacterium]|nr:hypothetical protein [Ktedonobacterales bacterium]
MDTSAPGMPSADRLTVLYRPVGEQELALIHARGDRAFPARLAWQPIFYPVTNEEYARQIARQWNARNGKRGYVTRFAVRSAYLSQFDIHTVGSSIHQEYWIPAERLEEFNAQIVGPIEVIAEYQASILAL